MVTDRDLARAAILSHELHGLPALCLRGALNRHEYAMPKIRCHQNDAHVLLLQGARETERRCCHYEP